MAACRPDVRRLAADRSKPNRRDLPGAEGDAERASRLQFEPLAGSSQQVIGVENACDLAVRFRRHRIEVVLADVVTPSTVELYRARLPSVLIVHLRISLGEARRRATQRPAHLTEDEFDLLHRQQPADVQLYDHVIHVDPLDPAQQIEAVRRLWR